MNKVFLTGWLSFENEPRKTSNGGLMLNNTIGVKDRFKRDGETSYSNVRITAFGKTAEYIQNYIHKGDKIGIIGRLDVKKSGDKTYTNVIVEEVEALSSRQNNTAKESPLKGFVEVEDDDPF